MSLAATAVSTAALMPCFAPAQAQPEFKGSIEVSIFWLLLMRDQCMWRETANQGVNTTTLVNCYSVLVDARAWYAAISARDSSMRSATL